MTSDELLRADATTGAAGAAAAEDLRLLRCCEPVRRFTKGELFLPMPVEDYQEKCSLWRTGARRRRGQRGAAERLCAPGELTPARLTQIGAPGRDLSLRFVERALGHRELRAWRRDAGRPRLAAGGSRFAGVGLLSRFIDAVMRSSVAGRCGSAGLTQGMGVEERADKYASLITDRVAGGFRVAAARGPTATVMSPATDGGKDELEQRL
jgi:hypothetical protein